MSRKVVHEFRCQQPLSSFTKTEEGDYCGECKTVIIDFSEKTNSEIIDILKANNGSVCGSVLRGQLEESQESCFGFRNKVALTGLAALLGIGNESMSAQSNEEVRTEIVSQTNIDSSRTSTNVESTFVQPPIETPEKPEKKKKERKRKIFLRIGSISFYTQNVFPFIGVRRIVMGKMKY